MTVLATIPASPVHSERLAAKAARGDKAALADLFEKHDGQLELYVYRRVTSRQVAEDITAEVWLRVTSSIKRYASQGEGSFCAWLFTIAKRLILDNYRNQQRRPVPAPDMLLMYRPCPDAGPAEQALIRERARQVADALEGLPSKQQECMALRYYDGLTEAETAAVMGVSLGSVKQYQQRAKHALRKSLGPVMLTAPDGNATSVAARKNTEREVTQ